MEAGDVLCHHPLTIHGSVANKSLTDQQIGLSLHYLGYDVSWHPSNYVMQIPRDVHRLVVGKYRADDKVLSPIYIHNN
jgi:ectoine hydroxylase-related dioxygenase (phytanoyl-CoA dioxygenase family)